MRDVGFYLLIAVILLMTIFALRGGLDGSVQTSYGEIRRLLEQELVTQVQVEDNTVTPLAQGAGQRPVHHYL